MQGQMDRRGLLFLVFAREEIALSESGENFWVAMCTLPAAAPQAILGFVEMQPRENERTSGATTVPQADDAAGRESERILLWSSNLWSLGEGLLGPLFAVFAQRIGGSILDITWAWAIYLGMTGLLTIVAGAVSDRIWKWCGRERMLVAGYALNAVCTFGYLLVQTPRDLFLVQAGLGAALALSNPTWSALYARYSPGEMAAGYTWGMVAGLQRLILAAAIIAGGYIVQNYSFEALFITMGTVQVIAALYQAQILRRSLH
ncbi:MAG: MFS transporter [Aestuariivirga sp.]